MIEVTRHDRTTTISTIGDAATLNIFHSWPEGIDGALLACTGDDGAGLQIVNSYVLRRLLEVLLTPAGLRAAGVDSDPALAAAERLQAEIAAVG